jgi:hypothetical protein
VSAVTSTALTVSTQNKGEKMSKNELMELNKALKQELERMEELAHHWHTEYVSECEQSEFYNEQWRFADTAYTIALSFLTDEQKEQVYECITANYR